jgi:hypothetical protein
MLTLYFAPGSSFMAPRIALHEIGTAFEAMPISFARRENPSLPALLAAGQLAETQPGCFPASRRTATA